MVSTTSGEIIRHARFRENMLRVGDALSDLGTNNFIKSFEVLGLFGYRNVVFDLADPTDSVRKDINILYGSNGAGKTKILRLIYSLLSWQSGEGHKGFLARTPFEQIRLTFQNGREVTVRKLHGLTGSFDVYNKINGEIHSHTIIADEDGGVQLRNNVGSLKLLNEMYRANNPDMFYLDDQRGYQTTSDRLRNITREEAYRDRYTGEVSPPKSGAISVIRLARAITSQFRNDVLQDAVFGQTNSDEIYKQLVNLLVSGAVTKRSLEKEALLEKIVDLERSIHPASMIGAIPKFDSEFYKQILNSADLRTFSRISVPIEAYLDSLSARIGAISKQVERMNLFVSELNRFYNGKFFSFTVRDGFRVHSREINEPIKMSWLSSGERQLFIIMASVFLTQSAAGLVIIDEPEISLNVLWQREFVGSLQKLSDYANVQYIMASHSLDILSSSSANVIQI